MPRCPRPSSGHSRAPATPTRGFDLFIRDATDRITKDSAFGVWIGRPSKLSLLRAIGDAHTAALADIRTTQDQHTAKLDELFAFARSGGAFQRAGEQGIAEARVRQIVERLGGQGIERDELLPLARQLDRGGAGTARPP